MPSFEDMKKHCSSTIIGEQFKDISNQFVNETFSNSTTYRKGTIYDCNMSELKELEFKFLKVKTYTMEKDQVEYMVQFRPGVNPEIDFDVSSDQKHRLGYYIDILDDNSKLVEKWLIIGKDSTEFDKYNVLKCNWNFEWLDKDRKYHCCLGCVRDRNNYNSGIWSDGYTTSIENQTAFIVPTNDETRGIDYGKRFMITDNLVFPKTYEVTKLMDTFPLGVLKVTLSQSHHNAHVDFCGIDMDYFQDDKVHMICNFKKSSIQNTFEDNNLFTSWSLPEVNEKLYVKGQPQIIYAIPSSETSSHCEWHIEIDGVPYDFKELDKYLDIIIDQENNSFSIAAINKDLAKYVITIKIYDEAKSYYDSVEMEVAI